MNNSLIFIKEDHQTWRLIMTSAKIDKELDPIRTSKFRLAVNFHNGFPTSVRILCCVYLFNLNLMAEIKMSFKKGYGGCKVPQV